MSTKRSVFYVRLDTILKQTTEAAKSVTKVNIKMSRIMTKQNVKSVTYCPTRKGLIVTNYARKECLLNLLPASCVLLDAIKMKNLTTVRAPPVQTARLPMCNGPNVSAAIGAALSAQAAVYAVQQGTFRMQRVRLIVQNAARTPIAHCVRWDKTSCQ